MADADPCTSGSSDGAASNPAAVVPRAEDCAAVVEAPPSRPATAPANITVNVQGTIQIVPPGTPPPQGAAANNTNLTMTSTSGSLSESEYSTQSQPVQVQQPRPFDLYDYDQGPHRFLSSTPVQNRRLGACVNPNATFDAGAQNPNATYDACGNPNATYDAGPPNPNATFDACGNPNATYNAGAQNPNATYNAGAQNPNATYNAGAQNPNATYNAGAQNPNATYNANAQNPNATFDAACANPNVGQNNSGQAAAAPANFIATGPNLNEMSPVKLNGQPISPIPHATMAPNVYFRPGFFMDSLTAGRHGAHHARFDANNYPIPNQSVSAISGRGIGGAFIPRFHSSFSSNAPGSIDMNETFASIPEEPLDSFETCGSGSPAARTAASPPPNPPPTTATPPNSPCSPNVGLGPSSPPNPSGAGYRTFDPIPNLPCSGPPRNLHANMVESFDSQGRVTPRWVQNSTPHPNALGNAFRAFDTPGLNQPYDPNQSIVLASGGARSQPMGAIPFNLNETNVSSCSAQSSGYYADQSASFASSRGQAQANLSNPISDESTPCASPGQAQGSFESSIFGGGPAQASFGSPGSIFDGAQPVQMASPGGQAQGTLNASSIFGGGPAQASFGSPGSIFDGAQPVPMGSPGQGQVNFNDSIPFGAPLQTSGGQGQEIFGGQAQASFGSPGGQAQENLNASSIFGGGPAQASFGSAAGQGQANFNDNPFGSPMQASGGQAQGNDSMFGGQAQASFGAGSFRGQESFNGQIEENFNGSIDGSFQAAENVIPEERSGVSSGGSMNSSAGQREAVDWESAVNAAQDGTASVPWEFQPSLNEELDRLGIHSPLNWNTQHNTPPRPDARPPMTPVMPPIRMQDSIPRRSPVVFGPPRHINAATIFSPPDSQGRPVSPTWCHNSTPQSNARSEAFRAFDFASLNSPVRQLIPSPPPMPPTPPGWRGPRTPPPPMGGAMLARNVTNSPVSFGSPQGSLLSNRSQSRLANSPYAPMPVALGPYNELGIRRLQPAGIAPAPLGPYNELGIRRLQPAGSAPAPLGNVRANLNFTFASTPPGSPVAMVTPMPGSACSRASSRSPAAAPALMNTSNNMNTSPMSKIGFVSSPMRNVFSTPVRGGIAGQPLSQARPQMITPGAAPQMVTPGSRRMPMSCPRRMPTGPGSRPVQAVAPMRRMMSTGSVSPRSMLGSPRLSPGLLPTKAACPMPRRLVQPVSPLTRSTPPAGSPRVMPSPSPRGIFEQSPPNFNDSVISPQGLFEQSPPNFNDSMSPRGILEQSPPNFNDSMSPRGILEQSPPNFNDSMSPRGILEQSPPILNSSIGSSPGQRMSPVAGPSQALSPYARGISEQTPPNLNESTASSGSTASRDSALDQLARDAWDFYNNVSDWSNYSLGLHDHETPERPRPPIREIQYNSFENALALTPRNFPPPMPLPTPPPPGPQYQEWNSFQEQLVRENMEPPEGVDPEQWYAQFAPNRVTLQRFGGAGDGSPANRGPGGPTCRR